MEIKPANTQAIRNSVGTIKCEVCGKNFRRITNTHLKSHNMTMAEYQSKYPDSPIDCDGLAHSRVSHLRGKTYSEVYGESKSFELKSLRSDNADKQWKSNEKNLRVKELALIRKNDRKLQKKLKRMRKYGEHRESRVCKQCGNVFIYKIGNHTNGSFCSKACFHQFAKENASNYRIKALALLPNECFFCGNGEKLYVRHIDGDRFNNDIENLQILCARCHAKIHKEDIRKSREAKFAERKLLRGIRDILTAMNLDLSDPNFKHTPFRILQSFYEIFEGLYNEEEIEEILSTSFPSNYEGIVLADNIECFSMCPHHFLPVQYTINLGYISMQKMIGLSKLPRLAELLAKRPVLQETLTAELADVLYETLDADGVMCVVEGQHMCMTMRGVKQRSASVITSAIRGTFKDYNVRTEFLRLIGK